MVQKQSNLNMLQFLGQGITWHMVIWGFKQILKLPYCGKCCRGVLDNLYGKLVTLLVWKYDFVDCLELINVRFQVLPQELSKRNALHKSSCCLHKIFFTLLIWCRFFFVEQILQACILRYSDEEVFDLLKDDTMTASHQNVNAPVQLSLIHFLCIRAFSQTLLNGGGVTTLNWVPVFAFQSKVNLLPRFCLLSPLCAVKADTVVLKREMKVWSFFRRKPDSKYF